MLIMLDSKFYSKALVEDAQLDVEKWEKNVNKQRTIIIWRHDVKHIWSTRPKSKAHKLIDRQPKIMQAIIDCDGGHTGYWNYIFMGFKPYIVIM